MTKKYYLVEEDKLKYLLHDALMLYALDCGGVDNWEWYGESTGDFLKNYIKENNIQFEDPDDEFDFCFEDIADREINDFLVVSVDLEDLKTPHSCSMELSN